MKPFLRRFENTNKFKYPLIMKKLFWTSLVIIIIFSGNACHKNAETVIGNWVQKSTFDGNARSGAVGFCIDNNFFLGFGVDGRNIYVQDFWKYSTETNSWTKVKPCPGIGRIYAVGFSIGKDGYVGTGQDKNINYLADFWKYQSDLDQWVKIDTLPSGGRTSALSFGLNNKGYVGTGFDGNTLKDFYVYDPTLAVGSQWTLLPGFGGEKRRNGVAFVVGGMAYVCTGIFNGTYVADLWKFDPTTQTWTGGIENGLKPISATTNSNYRIVRTNAVGFSSADKGYVALGSAPSTGLGNDVWEYDPTTDTWGRKTNFEGSARTNAVSFSLNNRMFVTTGQTSSYQFDDLWEFKPNDAYNAND
jgi:N-acetylneuraminic acid mutarotase